MTLVREIYEGFQRGELDRWDAIVAEDVAIYSPGMWGGRGRDTLKRFATEFITALSPRIDLVDEFDGGDRAFLTFCMHWHHVAPFFGVAPTGRRGTSVETLLLTIVDGRVVRFGIADNTLDLAIYLWDRGFSQQHNVTPEPIVRGIERG
jgi:hypothetical protein